MKLRFTLLSFTPMLFSFLQAQVTAVTLTSTDMPSVPWSQSIAVDTPLTTVNYGSAGANQVYDFSALAHTETQTASYSTLTNTQQTKFPAANIAITTDNSTYIFVKNNSAKWDVEGLQGYGYGQINYVHFSPVEDIFRFTTQYQGTYSGSWGFQQTLTGAQVGQPSADSVRVTLTDNYTDLIDGWGKTITPIGTYKSLRQKRTDQTTEVIEAYYCILFSCGWHNVSTTNENTTEYTYLAKETKGAVVSFDYDSAGDLLAAKYSMIPPAAPVAHFTDAPGGGGLINFTDNTDGYPTKYHWNFGDGDTTNTASPNHVYTANGAYYVCETVYDAGASNTYCDSVHVTGITAGNHAPQATNDAATVLQPSGTTVNVTANDVDPDNNALCVTAVYGNIHFTVTSCSSITYAPDSTFSGTATCNYIVCDNGIPVMCDTGTLIITSTFNHNLLPVATNDSVHLLQNESANINVGANDVDPEGGFCVTSLFGGTPQPSFFSIDGSNCKHIDYTPNSTFTGSDTVYYVICDNGHGVWCDTGVLVVKATSIASLTPVANADIVYLLQPDTSNINAGGNDLTPNGPACITTLIGGSPQPSYFSIDGNNCAHVDFHPDSTFTGNDTIYYVICDNVHPTWCDTGLIVAKVSANPALLPSPDMYYVLVATGCVGFEFDGTPRNAPNPQWYIHAISLPAFPDSTITGSNTNSDTVLFRANLTTDVTFEVCITSTNQFGSGSKCDTLQFVYLCTAINQIQLSGISISPNPTANMLTVDMRNNTDEITQNYAAIEIYNAIGETVKSAPRSNQNKLINIPVSDLPQGIYMATIVDQKGTKRTLGRFVKQ